MATRMKEGAQVNKERSSRSPLTPQSPRGRRTSKSPTTVGSSPDGDVPTPPGKPIPNYLKPTISSGHEASKQGKKQPSGTPTRKSIDKPPSLSTQPRRASSFGSRREVILKPLSPSPRTAISAKPISDGTSKTTHKTVKTHRSPRKGKGSARGKESGASSSTADAATSPNTSAIEPAKEEQEPAPDVQNVEHEERVLVEIPPSQDQMPSNEPEEEAPIISMEKYEVDPTPEDIDVEKGEVATNDEKDGDKDDEDEQFKHSEVPRAMESPEEAGGEPGEEGEPENPITDNGKAAREGSDGEEGAAGGEAEAKEDVAVKRQEVQGKKAAARAYNDVIEVTASKLVEKRKSKVKALVGAFETVISLEEPEGTQGRQPSGEDADETTNDSTT